MVLVTVSRPKVSIDNQLTWELEDVEDTALKPGEAPYRKVRVEPPTPQVPENYSSKVR